MWIMYIDVTQYVILLTVSNEADNIFIHAKFKEGHDGTGCIYIFCRDIWDQEAYGGSKKPERNT